MVDDKEEILLCFQDGDISGGNVKKLNSWEDNKVCEEVEDLGQKTISVCELWQKKWRMKEREREYVER